MSGTWRKGPGCRSITTRSPIVTGGRSTKLVPLVGDGVLVALDCGDGVYPKFVSFVGDGEKVGGSGSSYEYSTVTGADAVSRILVL